MLASITETRLEALLDKEEISSLVIRERYYRDTAQWEKLRACYIDDSSTTRIIVSWVDSTVDEFIRASQHLYNWGSKAQHSLTPVLVHINGARAISESTCIIRMRLMEDKAEYDFISQVRLVSKLERQRNLEWKMLSIETIYERDSIIPAGPISSTLSINSAGRRDSYKYTTWVLERSGFEIRNDLPGTDDPETVDRKMDELFQWLKS